MRTRRTRSSSTSTTWRTSKQQQHWVLVTRSSSSSSRCCCSSRRGSGSGSRRALGREHFSPAAAQRRQQQQQQRRLRRCRSPGSGLAACWRDAGGSSGWARLWAGAKAAVHAAAAVALVVQPIERLQARMPVARVFWIAMHCARTAVLAGSLALEAKSMVCFGLMKHWCAVREEACD